jgi:UPF0271 protein
MYKVDLNSDIGESFGDYVLGMDEEVIKYITSANIACGWHAGDAMVMDKTVTIAKRFNTAIGVHPGFPDLMGFGRREIKITYEETKNYTKYQIGALWAFAKAHGITLQHVKPHGSFYNMAAKDAQMAKAIAEAVYEVDKELILVGLAGSEMIRAGKVVGLKVANEVFADRAYNSDGSLVSRNIKGSVIHDKDVAINRVIRMVKEGLVTSVTGDDVSIQADTICVHGDNPSAVLFVQEILKALENEGVDLQPMGSFIK